MASNIEQRVMANVGTIYIGRALTGTTALKIYALILSIWAFGRLVWVSKVVQNFLQVERGGIGSLSHYLLYATEHTHLAVQLTLLVGAIACISLAIDMVRGVTSRSVLAI